MLFVCLHWAETHLRTDGRHTAGHRAVHYKSFAEAQKRLALARFYNCGDGVFPQVRAALLNVALGRVLSSHSAHLVLPLSSSI